MTVLLHMPLATVLDTHHDASAQRSERVVLRAATGVVVTSEWTRQQVLTRYAIPAHRVHVARPGVDQVAAAARPVRGHLICVGVLAATRGRTSSSRRSPTSLSGTGIACWPTARTATLTSSTVADPYHAPRLRPPRPAHRRPDRAALNHAYSTADLLVAPSARRPTA